MSSNRPQDRLADTLTDPSPNPEERLLAAERTKQLRAAVRSLPAGPRALIERHYGLGEHEAQTMQQLADYYKCTLAQIAYQLRLARAHLRELLR